MSSVSAHSLIRFATTLEGQRLKTRVRGKVFTLAVVKSGIEFTPESTGKTRSVSRERIQKVCDEFSGSHSLSPGDYQSITADASYLLTLIGLMERERARQASDHLTNPAD